MAIRVSSSVVDKNYAPIDVDDISACCSFILENIINRTANKSKTYLLR